MYVEKKSYKISAQRSGTTGMRSLCEPSANDTPGKKIDDWSRYIRFEYQWKYPARELRRFIEGTRTFVPPESEYLHKKWVIMRYWNDYGVEGCMATLHAGIVCVVVWLKYGVLISIVFPFFLCCKVASCT
jgi:hypothetical protein